MSSSAGNSLTAQAERERRQREIARASVSGGARAGPPPQSSSSSSRAVIAPSAAAEALTRLEVNRTAARNYSTSAGASGFTDDASLVGKLYVDDPVWGRWVSLGACVPADFDLVSIEFMTELAAMQCHIIRDPSV
jgi:hypothetical protein